MATLPRWVPPLVRLLVAARYSERVLADLQQEWPRQRSHRGSLGGGWWLLRMVVASGWTTRVALLRGRYMGTAPRLGTRALAMDAKVAARRLVSTPLTTFLSVGMLALGLASAAAFAALVDGVLLNPLPFPDPSGIVEVRILDPENGVVDPSRGGVEVVAEQLPALQETGIFQSLAPWGWDGYGFVDVDGAPVRVAQARVGGATGQVFRVPAAEGRWFDDDEAGDGSAVAVLSHGLRLTLFGPDGDAVGRTLQLNGTAHEIVGVLPPGLRPHDAEVWTPLPPDAESFWVFGRLREDVTRADADAQLAVLSRGLREKGVVGPYQPASFRFAVLPSVVAARQGVEGPIRLLGLGVAGLLLLTALNLTALVLVRALDGAREGAVRGALGAGGAARIRPVLGEVLLLVGTGLAGALALSGPALQLLLLLLPDSVLPPAASPRVDAGALAPTILVAFTLSLVLVVAAGTMSQRTPLQAVLATGGRGGLRSRSWLDGIALAGQCALAFALLGTAVLTTRSYLSLQARDPGFRVEELSSHAIALPPGQDDSGLIRTAQALEDQVRALTGVADASVSWVGLPELGGVFRATPGVHQDVTGDDAAVGLRSLGPRELAIADVGLLRGRGFTPADRRGAEPVALVNEAAAQRLFDGSDPLGAMVTVERSGEVRAARVVGVVPDLWLPGAAGDPRPEVFLPYRQWPQRFAQILVRSSLPPAEVHRRVSRVVGSVLPGSGVRRWTSLPEAYRLASGREQAVAVGLLGFAALALTLVAGGIVGAAARWVRTRRREHAIRVALGAHGADLRRRALATVLPVAALGILLGGGAFALASHWVEGVLYGVPVLDLPSLAVAAFGLLAAVAGATHLGLAATDWGHPGQLLQSD